MPNRIAIAVPARDDVKAWFAFDLLNAVMTHAVNSEDVMIPMLSEGTLLPSLRTNLVLEAKAMDATHVLFLDSDMRFPADTISRMLAHGDGKVVAANCARRKIPCGPTACNYDPVTKRGVEVYTLPESTGLERVDVVGTAVMLIPMAAIEAIPAPWFATPWDKVNLSFMGEDIFFCRKLKEVGIPLYIDHDLSREIGHIGQFEFRHDHANAMRETPMIEVAR